MWIYRERPASLADSEAQPAQARWYLQGLYPEAPEKTCSPARRRRRSCRRAIGVGGALLPGYAELHCISNFSFQRGASHPEELVQRAYQIGYEALAITDECSVPAWCGPTWG